MHVVIIVDKCHNSIINPQNGFHLKACSNELGEEKMKTQSPNAR